MNLLDTVHEDVIFFCSTIFVKININKQFNDEANVVINNPWLVGAAILERRYAKLVEVNTAQSDSVAVLSEALYPTVGQRVLDDDE